MNLLNGILLFVIKQYSCYVYDESYPIVLTTTQSLPDSGGVRLDTDHFGFSLDLDKASKYLWIGAPKGASLTNDVETPGTLHTCNLNAQNPRCNPRPDNSVSSNEDGNNQLFGISVNAVNSKSKGTSEVSMLTL